MNEVLLNALRGGKVQWQVQIGLEDYTDYLISVKGIEKRAHLDGSFTSATVTIELYGEANINVGQGVLVQIHDFSLENPIDIWSGEVKTIKNMSTATKQVVCNGALSDLDQSIEVDYPRSSQPRWLYNYLLQSALPRGWSSTGSLAYNDDYHRSACRLSAKYSTLARLSGVAYYDPIYFKADYYNSGSYLQRYSATLTNNIDMWDFQDWQTVLDIDNARSSAPTSPLVWHRNINNVAFLSTYIRPQQNIAATLSYWPLGQDLYMRTSLSINGLDIYPAIEQNPSPSSQEAPQESVASWRGTSEDALYDIVWTPPASTRIKDTQKFELSLGTTDQPEGQIIYGDISKCQFKGTIVYKHTNNTAQLSALYRSYNAQPQYRLEQNLTLATINAEPFKYEQMRQVALLGSLGIVEAGESLNGDGTLKKGYRYADLAPEKGQIYPIPICKSTCADVTFIQENPLPPSATVNFRDPLGRDYSYEVPLENGSEAEPITIDIMQGQLMGGTKNYGGYAGSPEYSMWSNSWDENPGALIDRWTGVSMSGVAPSFSYFSSVDLKIQNEDGTEAYLEHNLETGAIAYGQTSDYCVTERSGQKRYTFCLFGRIKTKTQGGADFVLPNKNTPWLDIFPLTQYLGANHRVFPDGRDTWSVRVPLAFANIEPGQVVVIDLPEIKSEPYLALIVSMLCESDDPSVTLQIIPMFPTSGASASDWPNLAEVLNIATSSNAKIVGIPYLPPVLPDPPNPTETVIDCTTWTYTGTPGTSITRNDSFTDLSEAWAIDDASKLLVRLTTSAGVVTEYTPTQKYATYWQWTAPIIGISTFTLTASRLRINVASGYRPGFPGTVTPFDDIFDPDTLQLKTNAKVQVVILPI